MLVSSTILMLVTLSAEALIGIFGIMYLLKLVPVISFAASCVIDGYWSPRTAKRNHNLLQWT